MTWWQLVVLSVSVTLVVAGCSPHDATREVVSGGQPASSTPSVAPLSWHGPTRTSPDGKAVTMVPDGMALTGGPGGVTALPPSLPPAVVAQDPPVPGGLSQDFYVISGPSGGIQPGGYNLLVIHGDLYSEAQLAGKSRLIDRATVHGQPAGVYQIDGQWRGIEWQEAPGLAVRVNQFGTSVDDLVAFAEQVRIIS